VIGYPAGSSASDPRLVT